MDLLGWLLVGYAVFCLASALLFGFLAGLVKGVECAEEKHERDEYAQTA